MCVKTVFCVSVYFLRNVKQFFYSIQPLSKRDAQQAFIKYASEKCCYSTKPAEEGVITLMETFDTYRVRQRLAHIMALMMNIYPPNIN